MWSLSKPTVFRPSSLYVRAFKFASLQVGLNGETKNWTLHQPKNSILCKQTKPPNGTKSCMPEYLVAVTGALIYPVFFPVVLSLQNWGRKHSIPCWNAAISGTKSNKLFNSYTIKHFTKLCKDCLDQRKLLSSTISAATSPKCMQSGWPRSLHLVEIIPRTHLDVVELTFRPQIWLCLEEGIWRRQLNENKIISVDPSLLGQVTFSNTERRPNADSGRKCSSINGREKEGAKRERERACSEETDLYDAFELELQLPELQEKLFQSWTQPVSGICCGDTCAPN